MAEMRQRNLSEKAPKDSDSEDQELETEDEDIAIPGSDDKTEATKEQQSAELKNITSGTNNTPEVLEAVTRNMSSKWKNWTIRFVLGIVMISIFFLILYLGPLALVLLVMVIQLKCFSEIINIGHIVYKSENLPLFRTLSWYFLFTSNYFIYGETMIDQFGLLLHKTNFLSPLVTYHRFISFSLYLAGIISFVMSLKKKYYVKQFTLFGYTHVTLLIIAVGANMIIRNIFEGIFWFFMACSLIICNDIWAYFFGFFFGKTPLIALSPKKTWEGYLGGGLATLVYATIVANIMVGYDNLVCPVEYSLNLTAACVRNPVFIQANYTLPGLLQTVIRKQQVTMYPITFHSLNLAVFASLIGPFGGFFASGFKRAFKIKDFGDIFPGHGGFMDRFDCQVLMGFFTNVYVHAFIKIPNPEKMLQLIFAMQPSDQLSILQGLCNVLQGKGLANCDNLTIKT